MGRSALPSIDTGICLGLLASMALTLLTAAVRTSAPREALDSRVVIDDRGLRVRVPAALKRAAVLFPPAISDYLVVTRNPTSVAIASEINRTALESGLLGRVFPAASAATYLGDNAQEVANEEALLLLRPDVVFANMNMAPELSRIGLATLAIENRGDLNYAIEAARIVAEANGKSTREPELLEQYRRRMWELANDLAAQPSKSRPSVAILFTYQGRITGFGQSDFQTMFIEAAGGRNALGPGQSIHLDRERLLAADPDVVLLMNTVPPSQLPTELATDPAWATLRAVRARRVYVIMPALEFFPMGLVGYPLYARWMAELLHPEMPARLREEMKTTYLEQSGYDMTRTDLDEALAVVANHGQSASERFEHR